MKPKRLKINFEAIPVEIKEQEKWILWKWEKRDGKWTKPPYNFNTNKYAKSNDPSTWGEFEGAVQALKSDKYDGIGFMLEESDPYTGIDWDNCYFDGIIQSEIEAEIQRFNSYTEFSPSGHGLKTLIHGKLPGPGHHDEQIGVFDKARYFCITGRLYRRVSINIESRQQVLEAFYHKRWPTKTPILNSSPLNCEEIVKKAMTAHNGHKFAKLWFGDISEYPSQSEADLGLCTILAFWTNHDFEKIDELFRQSGLMRDKWNRNDYRAKTIEKACNLTDGYDGQSGRNGQNGQTGLGGHQRTSTDSNGQQRTTNGQPTDKTPFSTDKWPFSTDNQRTNRGGERLKDEGLKSAIKSWILMDKRSFRIQDAYNDLDIRNRQQKKNVSDYLAQFCREGLIEKVNGQRGVFTYKEREIVHINYLSKEDTPNNVVKIPLGLEDLGIQVLPGNIVVVAGESNSGKTSILLNIAHDNLKSFGGEYETLRYFSSEMGPQELHTRVKAFGSDLSLWTGMEAIERTGNFHQVLQPDGLNIIDFMEIHDQFYLVGDWIRKIHETLKEGVCVIALQKKTGSDFGRSGEISLEKPRLYLSISEVIKGYSSCKIVKAKNYVGERNPNGMEKDFRIRKWGSELQELSDWRYVTYKERKKINEEYEVLVKQENAAYAERSIGGDETAYEFTVDGDIKRVTLRQVRKWRESFPGLDVDTILQEISNDSGNVPFLSGKNWFWKVNGILGKKYKLWQSTR